jgi:hypothetical protein
MVDRDSMLDELSAIGMTSIPFVCPACGAAFSVPISALDVPGGTPLNRITLLRTVPCPHCSSPGRLAWPVRHNATH